MDRYANFAELEEHEKEGKDYLILYRKADHGFAIMAPHGGGIELGTAGIADAIAGVDRTFYAFKGIKTAGNRVLHLTSGRFDEPLGIQTSNDASVVIAIHGCRDKRDIVFIGGKNDTLKEKMLKALRAANFHVEISDMPGLRGISPENFCNRCQSGEGVQLELSRGLRERMFDHLDRRSLRTKTDVFYSFVDAVREIISSFNEGSHSETETITSSS